MFFPWGDSWGKGYTKAWTGCAPWSVVLGHLGELESLRKTLSTTYVRTMRRFPRLSHGRLFTRIGKVRWRKGLRGGEIAVLWFPSSLSNAGVCAFLHAMWEHAGSCGLDPVQPRTAASLVQHRGKTELHNGESIWEAAVMPCTIHLVIINELIHKAS